MATPSFSTIQQVFALSMWSNKAGGKNGDVTSLTNILNDGINTAFQTFTAEVGQWTTVWGPAVYVGEYNHLSTLMADNAMYVAFNAATNTYVVAIAATNPDSLYDWNQEDFAVATTVPFAPVGSPVDPSLAGAVISTGTQLGITNLLALAPQAGYPGAGSTLQAFLASLPKQSYWKPSPQLFFTGHSLGGGLSPVLGLSLFPSATAKQPFGSVYVVPTAGATPWNAAFVNGFTTVFPKTADPTAGGAAYGFFNTALWNYYDVVPHAWYLLNSASGTATYPPYVCQAWTTGGVLSAKECLYGTLKNTLIPPQSGAYEVSWLVSHMVSVAAGSGVTYTPLTNNLSLGQSSGPAPATLYTTADFLKELAAQHIGAYFTLMNVQAIEDPSVEAHWLKAVLNLVLEYIEANLPHIPTGAAGAPATVAKA